MLDHDHIRAARASKYRELRIRCYETDTYVRIIVEAKPLNQCFCTFTTVSDHTYSKGAEFGGAGTLEEIQSLVGEHLLGDAPLF